VDGLFRGVLSLGCFFISPVGCFTNNCFVRVRAGGYVVFGIFGLGIGRGP